MSLIGGDGTSLEASASAEGCSFFGGPAFPSAAPGFCEFVAANIVDDRNQESNCSYYRREDHKIFESEDCLVE